MLSEKESHQTFSKKYIIYLGKKYFLLFINKYFYQEVTLDENRIYIPIYHLNNLKEQQQAIYDWYLEKAKLEFSYSLDRMYPIVKNLGVALPKLEIRKMKSRWGSCFVNRNKIVLNLFLIKTDTGCIDYVVLHELTHFLYPNHGKEFKNFIETNLPDFKERDDRLNRSFL